MRSAKVIRCDISVLQMIRIRIVYIKRMFLGLRMVSSVGIAQVSPSRPIASHKAIAFSSRLQQPLRGDSTYLVKEQRRWGTIGFMIVIHALTIFAVPIMFNSMLLEILVS